jgi:preprotein translocase subunit SecA
VLILFFKNSSNGRLAQILTGEGKSLTIALLAILLALQGKTVDVVTSNKVLAQRDSDEKKPLYKMFLLKCAHNIESERN